MNRNDLIKELSAKFPDLTKKEVKAIVENFFKIISEALKDGDKVEIRKFGTFMVKKRKSKMARNPKTGEKVFVDEKIVPYFKPSRILLDEIAEGAKDYSKN